MLEENARNDDRDNTKSEWIGSTDSAAYDPPTEEELNGLRPLGEASVRDGAIGGVSEPVRDGDAGPRQRPDDSMRATGPRRNPPETEHAGTGDGGITMSGGAAGGDPRHVDGAEIVRGVDRATGADR
ncbi:MAG TPA: hypothetical protein VGG84_10055 [Gemmatimonadaceae bacterium]|jgi:hypothetical protein